MRTLARAHAMQRSGAAVVEWKATDETRTEHGWRDDERHKTHESETAIVWLRRASHLTLRACIPLFVCFVFFVVQACLSGRCPACCPQAKLVARPVSFLRRRYLLPAHPCSVRVSSVASHPITGPQGQARQWGLEPWSVGYWQPPNDPFSHRTSLPPLPGLSGDGRGNHGLRLVRLSSGPHSTRGYSLPPLRGEFAGGGLKDRQCAPQQPPTRASPSPLARPYS